MSPFPSSRFQLFGLGHRRKLIFRERHLADAATGEILRNWPAPGPGAPAALFEPSEYRVTLPDADGRGGPVRIVEDEEGVWIEERGDRGPLTRSAPVRLPRFAENPRAGLLRALHAELLVNIMPFGPVPNLLAYPRPWYRDAAMMLLCFEQTGNLGLVEPWLLARRQVFDYNNRGEGEADNPGQLLYMLSLFDAGAKHPLVGPVIQAMKRFEKDGYLCGRSDFAEHPVYQTKWAKYGLRALGLDDPYRIPDLVDGYSSLFWMDYRDAHVPGPRFDENNSRLYPYLRWAEAHFYGEPPPADPQADRDFPLTWEEGASDASYHRMSVAGPGWQESRIATPHTWHAAEMFLYFTDPALGGKEPPTAG